MKKFLALVLCLTLVLTCFTALLGCGKPRTYTHGDWVIMHSAEGECLIFDLSEEGKQKEVLIFPTEVAGRKVTGTYFQQGGWFSGGYHIRSEKLTRLYFTEYVEMDRLAISINLSNQAKFFLLYDLEVRVDEGNFYGEPFIETRYKIYVKKIYPYKSIPIRVLPANVSYYYNYENAPCGGFYWLDDYDGEIIKYSPASPTREGYEFAGWYKEPECVNKWNFEMDVVPAKEYNPELDVYDGFSEKKSKYSYVETALYAKWEKV